MKVIRHYVCLASDELCEFLNQNGIPYQQVSAEWLNRQIYFDITECSPAFSMLTEMQLKNCIITKRVQYTRREIQNAAWLTCTPSTVKLNLVNEDISFSASERFGSGKAHHRVLTGKPFYVSAPIVHNHNQHFFAAYEATNQLFCTEHAKMLMQENNFPLSFRAVRSSKTDMPIGDLYDIFIPYSLPPEALELSNSEETFFCPVCGARTFLPPLPLQIYRKSLSHAPNICKTASIFGWGGNYAAPINIISHDVYLFLAKNHLTRGLQLEPIVLVE